MATLGPNELHNIAIPANWDTAMLTRLSLSTGETYEQLITDIARGLSIANSGLVNSPLVASLISTSQEATVEYGVGVSNGFERHTERTQPNGKRAAMTGGMVEMNSWDRALDWTWDALRKARRSQIDADIASAMADLGNLWEKAILSRLFKSTYTLVGSGKSYPIADGTATESGYIPPNFPSRATAFANTHSHLLRLSGITQANLEAAVLTLWEHGEDAPFTLLIAQADIAAWQNVTNVTGFVRKGDSLIQLGTQTDVALVGNEYIGVIQTAYGPVQMIASARIPTLYWAVYKSYGANDQRNPLIVRESPDFGVGAVLLSGKQYPITQFPLEGAILFTEFGVGVSDRVGAAIVYNYASASYVDPVIV
jgi:hypothetical protein